MKGKGRCFAPAVNRELRLLKCPCQVICVLTKCCVYWHLADEVWIWSVSDICDIREGLL